MPQCLKIPYLFSTKRKGCPEIKPESNENNSAKTTHFTESENTETICIENVYEGNGLEYTTLLKGMGSRIKGKNAEGRI